MPTIPFQQKAKQKNLILIFVVVIILILVVFVFSRIYQEQAEVPETPSILLKKDIKIDFTVLESPFLKQLQSFQPIEPFKEDPELDVKLGRDNPFLPY